MARGKDKEATTATASASLAPIETPERSVQLTRAAEVMDAKNVVMGERYTDTVTGFRGVAIMVNLHLTGCDQVTLEKLDKEKEKPIYLTVDASRLEELQQKERELVAAGAAPTPTRRGAGGPSSISSDRPTEPTSRV